MDSQQEGLPVGKEAGEQIVLPKTEHPLPQEDPFTETLPTIRTSQQAVRGVEQQLKRSEDDRIREEFRAQAQQAARKAQEKATETYKGKIEDWEKYDDKVGIDAAQEEWEKIVTDPNNAASVGRLASTTQEMQEAIDRVAQKEKRSEEKTAGQKISFFEQVKNFFKKLFLPKLGPSQPFPPPVPI